MPFSEELSSEQSKIRGLEAEAGKDLDKSRLLKEKLDKNRATFFNEVDSAKTFLNQAENGLEDTNNINAVKDYKNAIKDFLANAASSGRSVLMQMLKEKPADQQKLATIDSMAAEINSTSAELKNAVPFFQSIESAEKIYKSDAKPALTQLDEIKNNSDLTPPEKKEQILKQADVAIDHLANARKQIGGISTVPPIFQELLDQIKEPIDKALEEVGETKIFYETLALCTSDEYKRYFEFSATEDGYAIKSTAEFRNLPEGKRREIELALAAVRIRVLSEIEEKTCAFEHEQRFFQGKQKLESGDKSGAKTDLLEFYNAESKKAEHTPENERRLAECEELLKRIALFEIAEAEGRLNTIAADIQSQFADVSSGREPVGVDKGLADAFISNMRKIIDKARDSVIKGETLTVGDIYKEMQEEARQQSQGPLRIWAGGFQQGGKYNLIFDTLRTQQEIDNIKDPAEKRQKYLDLAKQARELGLFELSNQYYQKAFAKEIQAKRKTINREEFIAKMRSDQELLAKIDEHVDQWKKDFESKFIEEFKKSHDGDVPTTVQIKEAYDEGRGQLRQRLFNSLAAKAYEKAVRTLVHNEYQSNPAMPHAAEWNEAYGNTFVNVETFNEEWYQFWRFSDAEWNSSKWEIIVTICTTLASGGIAAGVARATVGAALTDAIASRGLTAAANLAMRRGGAHFAMFVIKEFGAKRAAAYGITHLAVESGAFAASSGAMSGLIYNDWSTYESPESFMKAWGHSALVLGGCKVGSMGYSFRPTPTTAVGKVADTMGSMGSEMASMSGVSLAAMAMSGEVITAEKTRMMLRDNIVLTIGLRGAHRLLGEGVEMERDESAERKVLYESEFLSADSKIPPEMAGKSAYIGTDGVIRYSTDAFSEFGVTTGRENGKNVFTVEQGGPYRGHKVTMTAKEFFRILAKEKAGKPLTPQEQALLPTVKQVRERMIRLKNHEVNHRVIETINNSSGGKLARAFNQMFEQNPALRKAYEEQCERTGKDPSRFQSMQEFMSEVADGTVQLASGERTVIENTVSSTGVIRDFSFDRLRQIDTQLVSNPQILIEHFSREEAAASSLGQPPQFVQSMHGISVGDRINAPGSEAHGLFVSRILSDGTVNLSTIDPRSPRAKTDTQLFHTTKISELAALRSGAAPEKSSAQRTPRVGDTVDILSSSGDRVYSNWNIVRIDPMSGEVFVVGRGQDGNMYNKSFISMESLMSSMEGAKLYKARMAQNQVPRVGDRVNILNSSGTQIYSDWEIAGVNPYTGEVTVKGPVADRSGRRLQKTFSNMQDLMHNMKNAESFANASRGNEAVRLENQRKASQIPQSFDIRLDNGTEYKNVRVHHVDYDRGKATVHTRDGKVLFHSIDLDVLSQHINRSKAAPKAKPAPVGVNLVAAHPLPGEPVMIRNEVQQPPEKVRRSADVKMIGDLHGNYEAFFDNVRGQGLVDAQGNWIAGDTKVVFHGDILADRNQGSLDIMAGIRRLQAQARAQGGEVVLIGGNHEDMAISVLTGKPVYTYGLDKNTQQWGWREMDAATMCIIGGLQGVGVVEFGKRFSSDPNIRNEKNDMMIIARMNEPAVREDIVNNMRNSAEGREILEQMSSMKLVEQIDDGLYLHTELTPEILKVMQSYGSNIGESVDNINAIYRQGLRFLLLGEGNMPADFDKVNKTFLDVNNRDYVHQPGQLTFLNEQGINYVVHGHTHSRPNDNVNNTSDGVAVIGVDHSYGKSGSRSGHLSVGRINKQNGQFENH